MGKEVVKEVVDVLDHIDVNIGNGHLMHHGTKSKWTSLGKTFSWRAIASTTTLVIAFGVYGGIEKAGLVGVIDLAVKLIFYYYHERLWIHLGKRVPKTVELTKENHHGTDV